MSFNAFCHYFFNVPPNADYPWMPQQYWGITALQVIIRVLIPVLIILLGVPGLVWYERRLLGWMQQRQGPNRVGPFGLLQTIADGVKLLFKEDMNPADVDKVLFVLAPIIFLIPALVTGGVIPWGPSPVWGAAAPGVNVGLLYILAWASLGVYGVVLAGWASNNKYSLLGGLRSSAQLISYELGMGLAIITIVLMSGSLDLGSIVAQQGFNTHLWFGITLPYWLGLPEWNLLKYAPIGFLAMVIYTISMLAETNRAPFDLPEAETELVAGYHTEYTSMKFATFFLGEYANMVVVSAINATLFWGGYQAPIYFLSGDFLGSLVAHVSPLLGMIVASLVPVVWLMTKIIIGLYFFIWIRATLPRLRYDMLMKFGWQGLLPISLLNILCCAVALTFGWLIGLVTWLVVFSCVVVALASNKRIQLFAKNTRRREGVTLHSAVQPYRVVAEHSGYGAQTLPPDAHIGGVKPPETEKARDAVDSELVGRGGA